MEGTCVETLPSLSIPGSPVVKHATKSQLSSSRNGAFPRSGSVSLSSTPEAPSAQLPKVPKYRRINGYTHKTLAYGAPDIVKKIFTGQLTTTYFNDICYGKRATPQEFRYSTPLRDRETELWEPKKLSREKILHATERRIQDARFRRQSQMEKAALKKEKERMRKSEAALMREADIISRGMAAYLRQLEREKQLIDAKIASRSKQKRRPKVD